MLTVRGRLVEAVTVTISCLFKKDFPVGSVIANVLVVALA